jgi:hypothetical protein
MIQDYSTKSVTIVDLGLFTELAVTLSKYFGKVNYYSPWHSPFPSSFHTEVGEGISGITRIPSISAVRFDTDLWVFTDIYMSEEQLDLVDNGQRVWGCRESDELERYRTEAKPYFKKIGIAQGPYEIRRGTTELRKYLQKVDGKKHWVKIDDTRGDTETFAVERYDLQKNRIDELDFKLGFKAELLMFTVEEHLEDTIDLALDTHSVDGDYPDTVLLGTEEKGEAYICRRIKYSQAPAGLRDIYEKLRPALKGYGHRGSISLESRMKNQDVYLGDPCQRAGSPPFELQLLNTKNLPDIFWFGAEGELIDPEIPKEYGVELIIHSDWADKNPLKIDYDKSIAENIKFRFNTEYEGETWIMPQGAGPRVAAIVEEGDNLEDCIDSAKEMAKKIRGSQIENFSRSFDDLLGKIKQMKEWGVPF